jgi:hypothetical protein
MPMKWQKLSKACGNLAALGALACAGAESATERFVIDAQPALTLRDSGDSVTIGNQSSVIAAPGGGFLVLRSAGRGQLAFYDSSGRLTRVIGRSGRGPGEVTAVSGAAFGPSDSLFIGDAENGRISVFAPGDYSFVRSQPAARAAASFRGTTEGRLTAPMVIVSRTMGRKNIGYQLVAWDGRSGKAFGSAMPFDRIGSAGAAGGGRLWIADGLIYELTLFDGDSVVRRVRREVDWFPRDTSPIAAPRWMGKGRPFVAGVSADGDDQLWVLIKRKNPRYAGDPQGAAPRPISPGGLPPLAEIFESVLEVLDPRTGALIDSRVLPGDVLGFVGPRRLYQLTEADSSGTLMVQIWKLKLDPR